MKALVTGASGFAGTWLCRLLVSKGAGVVGWCRAAPGIQVKGVEYNSVDIRDRVNVHRAMPESIDMVFHLAAMANVSSCETNPAEANATNVEGSVNVFEAMPDDARGLLVSTCHVYGDPVALPISEEAHCRPVGVYATTKFEAEQATRRLGRTVVIVRAFHHTGPEQSTQYALADWAQQVRSGAREIMVGNLDIRRDYADVRDVVAGYLVAAERGAPGETYNLCTGTSHSLEHMLGILTKGKARISRQQSRYRPTEVCDLVGDPTKIRELGWSPKYSIEETLESMLQSTISRRVHP